LLDIAINIGEGDIAPDYQAHSEILMLGWRAIEQLVVRVVYILKHLIQSNGTSNTIPTRLDFGVH